MPPFSLTRGPKAVHFPSLSSHHLHQRAPEAAEVGNMSLNPKRPQFGSEQEQTAHCTCAKFSAGPKSVSKLYFSAWVAFLYRIAFWKVDCLCCSCAAIILQLTSLLWVCFWFCFCLPSYSVVFVWSLSIFVLLPGGRVSLKCCPLAV